MPNSAFSARPSSLTKPVPGAQDDFEAAMSDLGAAPSISAPASVPAGADDFEAAMADLRAPAAPQGGPNAQQPFALDPNSPEAQKVASQMGTDEQADPSFLAANTIGLPEQLRNFTTRLQAGLAGSDKERELLLRKKFGETNVKVNAGGDLMFRRAADEKFKKLDPGTLELLNDFIPDFARDAVYEGAQLPFEVAGATAGAVGGLGLGAPVTVPGGIWAGRVVGSTFANKLADSVASAAGVPEDPERSKFTENLISTAAEAVLPVVGKAIFKRLPGTMAYTAAKEAGAHETVALSEQSNAVAQAAADLATEGRAAQINGELIGIPGANVSLMGHQINPDNPELIKKLGIVAELPKFINAQEKLAADWGSSLNGTLTEIARQGGHGPVAPEQLAKVVTGAVESLEEAEGKAIGGFRTKAMKELKNEKLPLPKDLATHVDGIMTELGFNKKLVEQRVYRREAQASRPRMDVKAGEIANPLPAGTAPGAYTDATKFADVYSRTPDQAAGTKITPQSRVKVVFTAPTDMRPLMGKLGITKTGDMRAFVNALEDFANASGDGLRISDVDRYVKRIGNLQPAANKSGGEITAAWGKFSSGLRTFRRDAIKAGLNDETDRAAYDMAMDGFGALRGNIEQLQGVLKEESGAKAIVTNLFSGKNNIPSIRAMKALTKDNPEIWGSLKEEFITQNLIGKFADRNSPTGFSSTAFLNEMDKKYGPEFMKLVLDDGPGPNSQTVRKLLTVTERLERTYKGAKADTMSDKEKTGFMNLVIGTLFDVKFKAMNGIQTLFGATTSTDKILQDIMTNEGIDKYIAAYPGRIDRKSVAQNIKDLLGQTKAMQKLKAGVTTLDKSSKAKRSLTPRRAIINTLTPNNPATNPEPVQPEEQQ